MKKILITGSRGVVGTWLTKLLREKGHEVFGIDLFHAEGEKGWIHKMTSESFSYARCDVADFRQLERVFMEVGPFDFVYHTAAEFGRWNGEDYYEQLWRTNAIGTKNIIRLQEQLHFNLIHFSSSEVYGDYKNVMQEKVMDEIEIKQMNDYALTKWVNEQQVRNSMAQFGTNTVIVRLFNTYGPGEWYHPYRSVNCKFTYHALHNLPVTVYKGHLRTSTYLEDSARTLANITENFLSGEVYNIGGSKEHSIEELVNLIWQYTGADKDLIFYEESEILTTKEKHVDVSKSIRDLAHTNSVSLEDGVRRTVDWMKGYYAKE